METAVERINNQTRRFITFRRRLFYKIYIKTSQIRNKNSVKQSVNIRDEIHFSDIRRSMNAMGPVQS